MRNKLVNLLVLFDEKDMRTAKDFVESPYFNKNHQLQKLFEALEKSHPEFSISKERVFKQVFPNKKYNDLKFRQICSALYKLLEEFLSIQKFKHDKSEKDLYLLSSLNELGDKRLFEKTDNKVGDKLTNHKIIDNRAKFHFIKIFKQN